MPRCEVTIPFTIKCIASFIVPYAIDSEEAGDDAAEDINEINMDSDSIREAIEEVLRCQKGTAIEDVTIDKCECTYDPFLIESEAI